MGKVVRALRSRWRSVDAVIVMGEIGGGGGGVLVSVTSL